MVRYAIILREIIDKYYVSVLVEEDILIDKVTTTTIVVIDLVITSDNIKY